MKCKLSLAICCGPYALVFKIAKLFASINPKEKDVRKLLSQERNSILLFKMENDSSSEYPLGVCEEGPI